MNYANKKQIPFVALVGEEEMSANEITMKNMESGDQTKISFSDLDKFSL